jgi:hypothetical protein
VEQYHGPIPMSIEDAVRWSKWAVEETRRVLSNGNNNPWGSVPGSRVRVPQGVMTQEILAKRAYENHEDRKPPADRDPIVRTFNDAKIAAAFKCGNCGENASVALSLLYSAGVAPISKTSVGGTYDHAFVEIYLSATEKVICDPWADLTVLPSERQSWKAHIWENDLPDDSLFRVEAGIDKPGSQEAYLLATSSQVVPSDEKMDMAAG